MMSPQPTSSMEPRLTMELKPTFSYAAQSRMAVRSAPDCEMKPTRPGLAIPAAKVAFIRSIGFMMPRQLGPTTRMPNRRAASSTRRSSSAPASPISLKPALMMITPLMPASPHSATRSGTPAAGVTMTARSTGSPMAPTDG